MHMRAIAFVEFAVLVISIQCIELKFNQDGKFKIVQFTDTHFGEGEDEWWGPVQDENSTRVMRNILKYEEPDLVVLTGDLITGNNILNNATAYWKMMLTPMIEAEVPWAFTFGNHDDLAKGKGGTRHDLMKFDMSFPLSMAQFGPSNIHGVSNYPVKISSSQSDGLATVLYMFDSGDGGGCEGMPGYSCIYPDQIEWYKTLSQKFASSEGRVVPAVAFFHIPIQEYMFVWNNFVCYGTNNDSVACQALNTGLFAAFLQMGDVKGIFVGHNHGNDFCSNLIGVQMCFGRHSGYGGYGNWERGARVIELTEDPFTLTTWIRFENGRIEWVGPQHTPDGGQTRCTG